MSQAERFAFPESIRSGAHSVMSFNILYIVDEERWERVVDMILRYMPDSVGMQEPTPKWLRFLMENQRFCEKYVTLPFAGREGQNYRGGPTLELICYRRDTYHMLDWGQKWLTDTPDTPSMVENAAMKRILTYAVLEHKETGKQVMHVNTHIDHLREDVRYVQAGYVLDFLAQHDDKTILLTGDFNTQSTSVTYERVVSSPRLADAKKVADWAEDTFTIPSDNPRVTIDYCFVTKENVKVRTYHVCHEQINGGYPSDHCPLFVTFDLDA